MLKYLLIALFFATPALAQQQQTSTERAVSSKLFDEINANIAMRKQIIEDQEKIADLQKKLEAKGPAAPTPPK